MALNEVRRGDVPGNASFSMTYTQKTNSYTQAYFQARSSPRAYSFSNRECIGFSSERCAEQKQKVPNRSCSQALRIQMSTTALRFTSQVCSICFLHPSLSPLTSSIPIPFTCVITNVSSLLSPSPSLSSLPILLVFHTGAVIINGKTRRKSHSSWKVLRGTQALITSCVRNLPIRVIRSSRLKSPYAPTSGFSFDGLFKVTFLSLPFPLARSPLVPFSPSPSLYHLVCFSYDLLFRFPCTGRSLLKTDIVCGGSSCLVLLRPLSLDCLHLVYPPRPSSSSPLSPLSPSHCLHLPPAPHFFLSSNSLLPSFAYI